MIFCSSSPLVPAGSSVLVRAAAVLATSAALLLTSGSALAERAADPSWEITALAGGGFGGSISLSEINAVNFANANVDFGAGWTYGGIIGLRPRSDEGGLIVLSYSRQRSTFTATGLGVPPDTSIDVDVGFLQIGGEIDGYVTKHIKPFFGLSLGATHYSPLSSSASTEWFFSAGFYGGLKWAFNKHVGLRFQGRMIGTVIGSESNIWCVSDGCVVSVKDVTGPIQGDLLGGVYVAF